jgi:hypothetical protein
MRTGGDGGGDERVRTMNQWRKSEERALCHLVYK